MTEEAAPSAGALLAEGRLGLAAAPFKPPPREATLLLAHTLEVSEMEILAHPERPVPPARADRYRALLERRLRGEPVAYLLGVKEFYGRPFRVDRRVLIPRPETEHLVELALGLELPAAPSILDIGTGSGAIAVTLALELAGARLTATDLSLGALEVAGANARALGARLRRTATDLAAGLDLDGFDLAVSNPPYVAPGEKETLSIEITGYEPPTALFAAERGQAVIARLLAELDGLRPGTWLLIEIGDGQADAVASRARRSAFELLQIQPDYGGVPRVAVLRRRAR